MQTVQSGLVVVAAILAWLAASKLLPRRSWLIKTVCGLIAAILAGGIVEFVGSFIGNYVEFQLAKNNPAIFSQYIEKELDDVFPKLLPTLRAQDPALLQDLDNRLYAAFHASNGGASDPATKEKLVSAIAQFRAKLQMGALRADDNLIMNWITAQAKTASFLREHSIERCAKYALRTGYEMAPEDRQVLGLEIAALFRAYEDGKAKPLHSIDNQVGDQLLAQALLHTGTPFSQDEVQLLSKLNVQPPDVQCALYAKMLGNIAQMTPTEGAGAIRHMITSGQLKELMRVP